MPEERRCCCPMPSEVPITVPLPLALPTLLRLSVSCSPRQAEERPAMGGTGAWTLSLQVLLQWLWAQPGKSVLLANKLCNTSFAAWRVPLFLDLTGCISLVLSPAAAIKEEPEEEGPDLGRARSGLSALRPRAPNFNPPPTAAHVGGGGDARAAAPAAVVDAEAGSAAATKGWAPETLLLEEPEQLVSRPCGSAALGFQRKTDPSGQQAAQRSLSRKVMLHAASKCPASRTKGCKPLEASKSRMPSPAARPVTAPAECAHLL
mmetsp:Transcript_25856/g.86033  ORF Transcript_25856/g.86033 Transcript_25856/m.86033 type:complete len:262 (+) Transcript_25856:1006-1791(+)